MDSGKVTVVEDEGTVRGGEETAREEEERAPGTSRLRPVPRTPDSR